MGGSVSKGRQRTQMQEHISKLKLRRFVDTSEFNQALDFTKRLKTPNLSNKSAAVDDGS
jgi:hypothetical protein